MFIAGLIVGVILGLALFLVIDVCLAVISFLIEHNKHIPEFIKRVGRKVI